MKKRSSGSPPIGSSSLIAVFTVLCLTVFALLTLSTAQANARLSDASAVAVSNYYEDDCQAEEMLVEIRKVNDAGGDPAAPSGVTAVQTKNGINYGYSCPIDETQSLEVNVSRQGTVYKILRWEAVRTGERNYDDSIEVWDGE